jgi:hypothetical protein
MITSLRSFRAAAAVVVSVFAAGCSDTPAPTAPEVPPPEAPRPGPPPQLSIVEGDDQIGHTDAELPWPLVVRVTRDGIPAVGEAVQWTAGVGGVIIPAAGTTDADGLVRVRRVLGQRVGLYTTTAVVAGWPAASVRFTSTARFMGAARLERHPGDGPTRVDTVLATLPPLRVRVLDDAGEPVAGVPITWTAPPFMTFTDDAGIAQLTVTHGRMVGALPVSASAQFLEGSPVWFTVEARAGRPTRMVPAGGDEQTVRTGALLRPFSVRVTDAYGNLAAGTAIEWSVTEGGGTITPQLGMQPPLGAAEAELRTPANGVHRATARLPAYPDVDPITFTAWAVTEVIRVAAPDYWSCFYYGMCQGTFTPDTVSIAAGGTVAWVWTGGWCDVVFQDDPTTPTSSAGMDRGRHFRTFSQPGTYPFRCTHHSSSFTQGAMTGVVVVVPQ